MLQATTKLGERQICFSVDLIEALIDDGDSVLVKMTTGQSYRVVDYYDDLLNKLRDEKKYTYNCCN